MEMFKKRKVVQPLELLENKNDRIPRFLTPIFGPVCCSLLGFGMAMTSNWGTRRPIFSGIQKHIILASVGGGLGLYFDKKRGEYLAKRDAVLRHYIELHPEDFPPSKPKKYGEILERWVPIR